MHVAIILCCSESESTANRSSLIGFMPPKHSSTTLFNYCSYYKQLLGATTEGTLLTQSGRIQSTQISGIQDGSGIHAASGHVHTCLHWDRLSVGV